MSDWYIEYTNISGARIYGNIDVMILHLTSFNAASLWPCSVSVRCIIPTGQWFLYIHLTYCSQRNPDNTPSERSCKIQDPRFQLA